MLKIKIKKGDQVEIIAGASKGIKGEVLQVFPDKNKAVVSRVNIMKKHIKPTTQNPHGRVIEAESPIHISNISLLDPHLGKPIRVGYIFEEGKKIRVSKKSGKAV